MAQYIDKSALVAEIESLENIYKKCPIRNSYEEGLIDGRLIGYKDALYIINTLEVKEVDLEKDIKQIVSLYYEGIKHYEDVIKKEREENGGSDLAIKIMDGVIDARELSIQYVIDKLKAQKGIQYDRKRENQIQD